MQPTDLLRVHHSLIAADALVNVVANAYDLGPAVACRLLSTGSNDHYLITSSTTVAVLRVYHHDHPWLASPAHYQFELDWLDDLHQHHAPVSYPLPQRDGTLLGALLAPEGMRYYALFSFAPGRVRYPLTYARHIWLMGAHTQARERFGDAWLSDYFWASRIQTLKLWLNADQGQE